MKKIIDEHGRVFGKVSVIDFIVILIVLVIGASVYVKFGVLQATSTTASTDKITYTITVTGIRDYTVKGFQAGDILYDKNGGGGNTIGTITDVKSVPAKKASETLDGKVVMGNYENRYDVTLTVESGGTISEGRYLINKTYELNANSSRTFLTKYCMFDGTIMEIQ